MTAPTLQSVLDVLPQARRVELGRHFKVGVAAVGTPQEQTQRLAGSNRLHLRPLVEWMGRDEPRRACEQHALDAQWRSRAALATQLLEANGVPDSAPPQGIFGARPFDRHAPRQGDMVQVRPRQYLVEQVTPPAEPHHATLVDPVCLDPGALCLVAAGSYNIARAGAVDCGRRDPPAFQEQDRCRERTDVQER